MKIITLISFCDLIANSSVLNGLPGGDRDLCVMQGIAQQFYQASWMWTVMLTYSLYSLVIYGKIVMTEWQMHLIVWGILTLIIVLPFSTSTYGTEADDDFFCWIRPKRQSTKGIITAVFWDILTFEVILFGSFVIMTYWGALMIYKLRIQQIPKTQTMRSALRTLIRYPVALFITWFPNAIYLSIFPSENTPAWRVIDCLSILQGGLTAVIFFVSSRESRFLWYSLFLRGVRFFRKQINIEADVEDSMQGASDLVEEDFHSDDAYYGRQQTDSAGIRESEVALSALHSPVGGVSEAF
jgi:hypothetical protein